MKYKLIIITLALQPYLSISQSKVDSITLKDVKKSQIFIETDPTAFLNRGYSLVLRKSATFQKNLNIGLGIYKVELPEFYIEAVQSNKDKNWQASTFGFDVLADYFFTNPNKGLSLGMLLSYYNYNIARQGMKGSYQSIVETLRMGYLWRPIKKVQSIYLYPWAGISTGQKISGNKVVNGETFTLKDWNFVPSVQIGISF